MMDNYLKDKVAIITGGAGVLCSTFARDFAERGAKVAILDLDIKKAEEMASEIKDKGGHGLAVKCNVLDKESVIKAKDEVMKEFGTCDILINGAGGNHPKGTTTKETLDLEDLENDDDNLVTFYDLEKEGFEFVYNLNFMGTVIPVQVFSRTMIGRENSVIINISSMAAYCPMTRVPAYAAAKAAISNFTEWLAVHLAEAGIRVNAIAPGFFLTEQNKELLQNEDGTSTPRMEKIVSHTPMRRLGKPEELLGTLRYLCNEGEAGFVTGIVIPVDGGFMAYSGV